MVAFPNVKINLGLNILSKRADGYHNIASVFYPVPFQDALEILPAETFKFTSSGLNIPGNEQSNLVIKAYKLLKEEYNLPPVHIHLHKNIPMGAGLGGGSADAAFTIKSLNNIFNLALTEVDMEAYAGKLGSDCPFFIKNTPVMVRGTGTTFSPISLSLKGKYLVLICPELHVSTQEAYSQVTPQEPEKDVHEIIENVPFSDWKHILKNDFEDSVFKIYPQIRQTKELLYASGAVYASMSGSGSSVYGLFEAEPTKLSIEAAWSGFLS